MSEPLSDLPVDHKTNQAMRKYPVGVQLRRLAWVSGAYSSA